MAVNGPIFLPFYEIIVSFFCLSRCKQNRIKFCYNRLQFVKEICHFVSCDCEETYKGVSRREHLTCKKYTKKQTRKADVHFDSRGNCLALQDTFVDENDMKSLPKLARNLHGDILQCKWKFSGNFLVIFTILNLQHC